MLDELKAHLEEMLRGFRSGVAVYEEHIVEALDKLERAAAQITAPIAEVPPAPEAEAPAPVAEPEAAPAAEAPVAEAPAAAAPAELAAPVAAEQPAAAV